MDLSSIQNVIDLFNINDKTDVWGNLGALGSGGWIGATAGSIAPDHPLYGASGSGSSAPSHPDQFDQRMNDLYSGNMPAPQPQLSDLFE
ncbi:MAG: hypothetical protein WCW30_03460 [Candidatus Gracilibacteria bacterium]|jgi:hypothetical protein